MNRSAGWIVAIAGVSALALSGYWMTRPDDDVVDEGGARPFVVPVVLAQVETGDVTPRTSLSGTVRAARRARLAFDTSGVIEAISAREADAVAEGTVLANLDDGDERFELAAAEAAYALAQRQHDLLLAGEREEEKARLLASLDAARAEAELRRLESERGAKLRTDGLISQSEQDQRIAAYAAADKRRLAAEEDYDRAVAGTRAEDLAVSAARVDEAQTRVDTAEHDLGKTRLVAPWPGSIIERYVSVGDHVSAGDPVVELVDLENLEVHIEVPGRFAPRVGNDSIVRLTIARESSFVIEKPLDATIPAADALSRGFRAIVRLDPRDDPDRLLKPGMSVEAQVMLRTVRDALVVPSDAVLANDRGSYLVRAVATEGGEGGSPGMVADFVPVTVLAEVDGRSAVRPFTELDAGDSVVLVGGDNAFPGATLVPRDRGGDTREEGTAAPEATGAEGTE